MQILGLEAPNRSCMGQDAVDQVTVDVRDAPAAEAKLTPTENRGHVISCNVKDQTQLTFSIHCQKLSVYIMFFTCLLPPDCCWSGVGLVS